MTKMPMMNKARWLILVMTMSISCFLPLLSGVSNAAATHTHKVCGSVKPGYARCNATILTDSSGVTPLVSGTSQGYGPADFRAAYGVTGNATTHAGIVTAFDAPHIQADLTSFSKAYGLPVLPACTSATQVSCFEKFNEHGSTSALPSSNSGWSIETSLDVESMHGMCPDCRISLVEASSSSITNLSTAANEAATLGAKVISNSYGGSEIGTETNYDPRYHKAGVTMVASSGDSGYGTSYPAASPYVVAVGGTSLHMSSGHVVSEQAWDGSGSGCSTYETKPSWQHDPRCSSRSIADISADADPNTGAAIYDSYPSGGRSGWFTVGGTSLASPLVAGIIANSGVTNNQPATLYANNSFIRDITTGSNGDCASYFCHSTTGYDGPTGLGVLNHL
jgi:subtilase family serine protease